MAHSAMKRVVLGSSRAVSEQLPPKPQLAYYWQHMFLGRSRLGLASLMKMATCCAAILEKLVIFGNLVLFVTTSDRPAK